MGRKWIKREPVIAVLGPDGVGKGTMISALLETLNGPVRPVYFGLGESRREYKAATDPGGLVSGWGRVRAIGRRFLPTRPLITLYVIRKSLSKLAKLASAYFTAMRGTIVLCDRHILDARVFSFEYLSRFDAWIERTLARLAPWPDLVILLDAEPETIYARKADRSIPVLTDHRSRYREFFEATADTVIITMEQPLEAAVSEALSAIGAIRLER